MRLLFVGLWLLVLNAMMPPVAAQSAAGAMEASLVTGALLNEKTVAAVVQVDPSRSVAGSVPTIKAGLQKALETLRRGVPTKVLLAPGTYRESAADVRLDEPVVRDTLLVIEAAPNAQVVWSGADLLPAIEWKDEGNGLWSHDWPHNFGNFAYPWGVPGVLGHRREMAWVNGRPLRPVLLETYDVKGLASFGGQAVSWTYSGFLSPQRTLTANTFGVAEREENGRRIYLRLAPGAKLPLEGVEVAMRPRLLSLSGKSRAVLRGISFEKCANSERDLGTEGPVSIGFNEDDRPGDILLDRCRFRWNSGTGFNLRGWRWTVRDCDFSYNGFSGLTSGDARNLLFERVSANFNCWREFLAGNEDWNYGGMKLHSTDGMLVRGYTAIGNATHGIWWDVHCSNITLEDAVLIRNRRSFIFELGQGPFVARRVLAVDGFRRLAKEGEVNSACLVATSQRARLEDCVFYTDDAPDVAGFLWYERDDEHARQKPLLAELFELRHCVIVAGPHVPLLLHEGNVGDRKRESYRSFRYAGQNNVFFHLGGRRDVFAYHDINYQLVKLDFDAWAKRSETNARWLDPKWRDIDNYDFRLAPNSPLSKEFKSLPQYAMPKPLRAEMEQFFRWIGWKPQPPIAPAK